MNATPTADASGRALTISAAVVLATVLAIWVGRAALETTAREGIGRAAIAAKVETLDLPLAEATRQFPVELPDGRRVALLDAALAEQPVVLLNFWATWCPPCLTEMPSWLRLARAAPSLGVALVAISYDDDWAAQRRVLAPGAEQALPGGIAWGRDPSGQAGDPAAMLRTRLGTEKLPETWVIAGGRVVGRFVGAQQWDQPELLRYLQQVARAR